MQMLKDAILEKGRAINQDVLLVDSFLNHQVDVGLMKAVGEAFAEHFSGKRFTRVVTIESSGIAPALMTALKLHVPMVIMKKQPSRILKEDTLQTEVFSFTKNAPFQLTVKAKFLPNGQRVLIIDDFLANGEAASGAIRLIEKAGGVVAGVGAVIAKVFQPGMANLKGAGYRVEVLAPVRRLDKDQIEFLEEKA